MESLCPPAKFFFSGSLWFIHSGKSVPGPMASPCQMRVDSSKDSVAPNTHPAGQPGSLRGGTWAPRRSPGVQGTLERFLFAEERHPSCLYALSNSKKPLNQERLDAAPGRGVEFYWRHRGRFSCCLVPTGTAHRACVCVLTQPRARAGGPLQSPTLRAAGPATSARPEKR